MKRIDFLICGTQKGGTTALYEFLKKHPELFLPNTKELHYFDDETINWLDTGHELYHEKFPDDKITDKKCGEVTPIYMYWRNCAERIWRYNKAMKIIIVLRNPITRAYSHWNMECNRNAETLKFYDAIITELERCRSSLPLQHRTYSYVDRGFYTEQIRRFYQFFPLEQIQIIKYDEVIEKPEVILSNIYKFLGIKDFKNTSYDRHHVVPYKVKMDENSMDFLIKLYQSEIHQIEYMLNWNCSEWLDKENL
jgi:hypothetical protein